MTQTRYRFIEPLPPGFVPIRAPVAPGDRGDVAIAKLQGQFEALSLGNEIYAGDQLVYAGSEIVIVGYSAPHEVFSQASDPDVDSVAINIKPIAGGLYELWGYNLASPLP